MGQIQIYECRARRVGGWNCNLIKWMIQISTKATVKDLERPLGLKNWSSDCNSDCSQTGLKFQKALKLKRFDAGFEGMFCVLQPWGIIFPSCIWDTSMVIKRKNWNIGKGSCTSRQDLPASTLNHSPSLQIFTFMAQRKLHGKASRGEHFYSSGPRTSLCNRTQISPSYSQGCKISGFEVEPRNHH